MNNESKSTLPAEDVVALAKSARFSIGDKVWYANRTTRTITLTCPDCLGARYIRCILIDGSEHTVGCSACEHGWEISDGFLRTYELTGYASEGIISGLSLSDGQYKFTGDGFYEAHDTEIFATEADAKTRADQYAKELTDAEHKRLLTKEKDTKSWSWNVHWHRKAIRDAEKQIAYHSAKLNFAKTQVKPEAVHE